MTMVASMVGRTKTFATPEVLKKVISSDESNENPKKVSLVHTLKVFLMNKNKV